MSSLLLSPRAHLVEMADQRWHYHDILADKDSFLDSRLPANETSPEFQHMRETLRSSPCVGPNVPSRAPTSTSPTPQRPHPRPKHPKIVDPSPYTLPPSIKAALDKARFGEHPRYEELRHGLHQLLGHIRRVVPKVMAQSSCKTQTLTLILHAQTDIPHLAQRLWRTQRAVYRRLSGKVYAWRSRDPQNFRPSVDHKTLIRLYGIARDVAGLIALGRVQRLPTATD